MVDCSKCDAKCCKQHWLVKLTNRECNIFKNDVVFGNYMELPCKYLKHDKCSVYEDRPETCRNYTCEGDKRI